MSRADRRQARAAAEYGMRCEPRGEIKTTRLDGNMNRDVTRMIAVMTADVCNLRAGCVVDLAILL